MVRGTSPSAQMAIVDEINIANANGTLKMHRIVNEPNKRINIFVNPPCSFVSIPALYDIY
jgi:hypothetical protein